MQRAGVRDERTGLSSAEEDVSFITAVAQGDRSGLARLYDRYAPVLMGLGTRMLGSRREAEDLLHDLFLEVWRQAGDYDPKRGSVRTWILMRARSRAIDRLKTVGSTRVISLEERPSALDQAGGDDPDGEPDRQRVRRALAALPREQRVVLELGYYEGLSSTEIADRVAIPLGTVKSRVAAALAKLRAELHPTEETP
jgi:RNA polymerase sigma-70 factor (ECF subfamily)